MTTSQQPLSLKFNDVLELLFMIACGTTVILFFSFTLLNSEPRDFGVFYNSARAALQGEVIYRHYGPYELPYWYFPWLAWFYIPFALFPEKTALVIYLVISLACAFGTINYLLQKMLPDFNIIQKAFIFTMALLLCWLLFRVGQMDFILLAIALLMIVLLEKGKFAIAALMVPILLLKPHIFILFLPAALYKGKGNFFKSTSLVMIILFAVSFILIPDWPQRMVHLLSVSGQRTDNNWNFTTLPTMFGLQENWSGTANLPFTIILILIGFAVIWRYRELPTTPYLYLALAGSLFCAPRAYSYNFPILIPAIVWISSNLPRRMVLFLWLAIGITAFLFRFSTGTYSIVLLVFLWGILKAHKTLSGQSTTLQVASE